MIKKNIFFNARRNIGSGISSLATNNHGLKFISDSSFYPTINSLKYFSTKPDQEDSTAIDTFDQAKTPKLIIPIKVYEPLLPFGNSCRYFAKEDPNLAEILKRYKDDYEKLEKFAAFLYDKKKKKFLPTGVQCNLLNLESTGEISIISKQGDKRVQLIYPDSVKFEGEYGEVIELNDKESANRLIDHEFAKNIISDINKVIINCLGIVSKPMSMMESSLIRDLNSVLIYLQGLMQANNEFISNSHPSQYSVNFPEGINKLNMLIYKNIQEMLKIAKTIRKYTPFNETEDFLKCEDPVLRTKMLIDFIYYLGDYIIKEMHMFEEYKKDTLQKQEKFYLRFVKKTIEKIAGNESYEDYKKRFEELVKKNEFTPQTKRAIEIELELASGNNRDDGFDLEDRKKFGIVEEIFTFPWDKRDEVDFDIQHAQQVFEKNLYGMEKVKERVYEYIAKLKRTQKDTKKGFVILVTGPPGTGKTTVAQLIGQALKRKTGIINLSGESDNITLKGSRRTYVDAQPSIFLKEMVKLGVKNPVLVLDEIDKLSGSSGSRSQTAASALLEILNPEENHNFIDQFLNVPLDFSETIFICTANYTLQMLEPLLDRIEVIEIDDYTFQDKKDISEKFLIPNTLKEFGYTADSHEHSISTIQPPGHQQQIEFTEDTITKLIKHYSSPAGGVRGIKKNIEKIIRRANLFLAQHPDVTNLVIEELYLNKFLGNTTKYDINFLNLIKSDQPGSIIAADLKGYLVKILIKKKILPSEVEEEIKSKIENPEKKITSKDILHKINTIVKLEKHVEEALQISINLAKYKLIDLINKDYKADGIQVHLEDLLREYNIYSTTPYLKKYGNSYGLAFYISLLSAVLGKKIPQEFPDILVVGEISPLGNVLKVKGLKHFLSICEFYDIKNLMLPEGNRKEFEKYLEHSKKSFDNVFFVKTSDESFDIFFGNARSIAIPPKEKVLDYPQSADEPMGKSIRHSLH